MSTDTLAQKQSARGAARPSVVNDVVIEVATSNGTGSQSSNMVLVRSIFQMGVPVGAKNHFPSNIQGLPTWFDIRVNKDGWTGYRTNPDVMVAMNIESVAEDIKKLAPGSVLVLNDELKSFLNRSDLIAYVVPFNKLIEPICPEARLRRYVANMVYTGVVGYLLSIDLDEILKAIDKQFPNKAKAAEMNKKAAQVGYQWASENADRRHGFKIERMNETNGMILVEGNDAAAMGFMFGGVTVVAWYPITPASGVVEYIADYLPEFRKDPKTGKATYVVIQSEDEIAAVSVIVAAGWAGARAMTATSGPGMSLMAETVGLAYFTEVPAVICNVQRLGPSTGLPTRTSQGDILKGYTLSHGDCKHIELIPGNMEESYEFAAASLEIAERFQTIVFLMLDLDLGMNTWLSDAFRPLTKPMDRGKVLSAEDLDRIGKFQRYADVDGDGIPYRTLPGTRHPMAAYFTRGSGHTINATYSEKPQDWQGIIDRLTRKLETARKKLPAPEIDDSGKSAIGVIAFGSSDLPVQEARAQLKSSFGLATDYLRIRALPAHEKVREFIARHRVTYLVEQNRDAQMASILRMEWPEIGTKIKSVLHYNGMPLDARTVTNAIVASEKGGK